jgi:hypothetical protein
MQSRQVLVMAQAGNANAVFVGDVQYRLTRERLNRGTVDA